DSDSHFTRLQALEPFLDRKQINLKFVGSSWARVDAGLEGDVPATNVRGITYQVLEQLGFRKIVDTKFMIAFMFPHSVDAADVDKYMQGLKRAQMDLDFAPEKYKHFYLNEIPDHYKSRIDVRRFSSGERIVFLPYGEETYAGSRRSCAGGDDGGHRHPSLRDRNARRGGRLAARALASQEGRAGLAHRHGRHPQGGRAEMMALRGVGRTTPAAALRVSPAGTPPRGRGHRPSRSPPRPG